MHKHGHNRSPERPINHVKSDFPFGRCFLAKVIFFLIESNTYDKQFVRLQSLRKLGVAMIFVTPQYFYYIHISYVSYEILFC